MDLGLERITRLLESLTPSWSTSSFSSSTSTALKPPHLAIPILHVAGTNGKGSICAYLASVLQASGFKVGRYNSPHLLVPRDTIQVNGQPISQSDYDYVTQLVRAKDSELGLQSTSFELLTAAAFYWFAYGRSAEHGGARGTEHGGVDVAVIEVGVGGRLDATNIMPAPAIAVIASIGMDHAGLLGNTVEEVAFEKAGITKAHVPVVIAPQIEGEKVYKVLEDRAKSLGLSSDQIYKVKPAHWIHSHNNGSHEENAELDDGYRFWVPLLGDFQLENVATAIQALRVLANDKSAGSIWKGRITEESIRQGIRGTVWPGRLQWVQSATNPKFLHGDLLVDGAHNPAAAVALRKYLDQYLTASNSLTEETSASKRTVHWIMAFTKGKDIEEMFEILFPESESESESELSGVENSFSAVEFSPPEGMPWVSPIAATEVCARLDAQQKKLSRSSITSIKGFGTDLAEALTDVGSRQKDKDVVILCGSLYLVADLMRL
ncbi:dihydrofolate synthase / folylpolyglutamate synthase [Entomortierella parvispora]|uniref:Dihydrofolate synthase / folylpolyglutamate synthase n=1 Tax=Entomortierella parvispora TaxID=205924 RepID=A0A9P3M288_9FUNG|nr:dihydrofolate synthase / folylpolyglutamate synthase [Entomortierella parvispora]